MIRLIKTTYVNEMVVENVRDEFLVVGYLVAAVIVDDDVEYGADDCEDNLLAPHD
jgi:hypothetical protein